MEEPVTETGIVLGEDQGFLWVRLWSGVRGDVQVGEMRLKVSSI